MITLETTITHTEKRMLKLSTPAFWKEPSLSYDCYRAVLDEKTYVQVLVLFNGEVVSIKHSSVEKESSDILKAQEKWDTITEQEFIKVYDDTLESISLRPKLAV